LIITSIRKPTVEPKYDLFYKQPVIGLTIGYDVTEPRYPPRALSIPKIPSKFLTSGITLLYGYVPPTDELAIEYLTAIPYYVFMSDVATRLEVEETHTYHLPTSYEASANISLEVYETIYTGEVFTAEASISLSVSEILEWSEYYEATCNITIEVYETIEW